MNWVDFLHNPQALRHVYGEYSLPDFSRVHLHEMSLGERLDMRLRFSLQHMPASLPRRWPAQANRVQITLAVWSIASPTIEGWDTANAGMLDVHKNDDHGQVLRFTGMQCRISSRFEALRIEKIDGYIRTDTT